MNPTNTRASRCIGTLIATAPLPLPVLKIKPWFRIAINYKNNILRISSGINTVGRFIKRQSPARKTEHKS